MLNLAIEWEHLGRVVAEAGALQFPSAPDEPGVYRFHFWVEEASAEYLGEAASLRSRFASYAAAIGKAGTNTRMRYRMERTLEAEGSVDAFVARPTLLGRPESLDLSNKLVRVFVEHAAATDALLRESPLLNGRGYPPMAPGSVLSGAPAEIE